MAAPRRTPTASWLHLLLGIPVGQDDGGLMDNSVVVPFEAVCQERSDGSIVCTRGVHEARLGMWLISATMLLIGPGVVIYFVAFSSTRLRLYDAMLMGGIGLALAGLTFVLPSLMKSRDRELVIRGAEVAIWMPRLQARLRTMVWHSISESTLRIHPLSVHNVLWSGHVLAFEVGKYRMLLAAARDRSDLDAVVSRLPEPIRARWDPEPGAALAAPNGNRYFTRRGRRTS